jgi:porin
MNKSIFAVLVCGFLLSFAAAADQQDSEGPVAGQQQEAPEGGWNGKRSSWANDHGFQWDIDTVTWTDQALDGGTTDDLEFGGNLTYDLNWDLMRADILPGALLTLRAETRWGSSGMLNTGSVVPLNTAALTPTNYTDFDEGYGLAVTQLSYLQMLSTKFGLLAGKLDLFGNGDMNEFATGRGRTQFMNWSLNYGTSQLLVPASTLGVGMVILPSERWNIVTMLTSATECVSSNCFKDLDDKGGVSITSVGYQYQLGGLPGGVTGSYIYFFDVDFEKLDGQLPVPPPPGYRPSPNKDTSWIVGGTFWQYISTRGAHEGPINLMNRKQDLAGWGIFGRVTLADDETNPWETSVALGLGARGIINGRPDDEFGVGYFYNALSNNARLGAEAPPDGRGIEGYYNAAILPSLRFSLGIQWIRNIKPSVRFEDHYTFALSTRLQVVF